MGKRKPTSVSTPKRKKKKLTNSSECVLYTTELIDRIIRFVPRDKVLQVALVSRRFLEITRFGPVQEYLHDVPPEGKVGEEVLLFRGERIADYVRYIGPGSQSSLEQMHHSCIQGYGGERFLNHDDEAFKDIIPEDIEMILENKHCARPCLLDSKNLASCYLNPGPFKRIIYTLLVAAWDADTAHKNMATVPLRPLHFEITCDAKLVGDITWTEYYATGDFSKPRPKNTFEATVGWVFELLARYSETRNDMIRSGASIDDMDYIKAATLRGEKLVKAFRVARSTSWSLEQTCYIVDRIPEEPCI